MREVLFCNSPSVIAIAAVQYAIGQTPQLVHIDVVSSLKLSADHLAKVKEVTAQVAESTAQARETHEKAK